MPNVRMIEAYCCQPVRLGQEKMAREIEVPVFIKRGGELSKEPVGTLRVSLPDDWPEGQDSCILLTPQVEGEPCHESLIGLTLRMLPNPHHRNDWVTGPVEFKVGGHG